ncbi:MAG: glycosyl hydrolase family 18 protein [Deltaproteobacteria bacterium]|jgi:spore germination protein YaaH|nr:glycosyl hydrolase family 18 protein [Deltaproteobacteria bacterium]
MKYFIQILVAFLCVSGAQAATITDFNHENQIEQPFSVHRAALVKHKNNDLPVFRDYGNPPNNPQKALNTIVYGYLPYWISDLSQIRWSDLSHLAYFSVEINSSGQILDTHGWPDNQLVQTAHNNGVMVELVFTLFSSSAIDTLLASSSARNTLIGNMVDLMESGSADGINIDFEFVPASARDNFTAFLIELRNELNSRGHLNATISFAGPTGVSDGIDFAAVFDILDYYFIMAYGYHWSGSSYAGPPGKYRVSSDWQSAGSLSLLRTLARISKAVGEDRRAKIIAGLPIYGREWTTNSSSWPASAISHIGSVTYSAARQLIAEGKTRYWDEGICSPVIIWNDGSNYHQAWYEDAQSLDCKYQLIKQQKIGGVGFWALGYDNGYGELWDKLEEHFTTTEPPVEGSVDLPIPITSFPFTDSNDTSISGTRYFNYYSCNSDLAEYGREFVYQIDICTSGTLTASVNDDAGVDPDLQLLSSLSEDACLDRAHIDLQTVLEPGRYYLVVDTYVDEPLELEGVYNLAADFSPDNPQDLCPENTHCEAGSCVCDNDLDYCAGQCVDTDTNSNHCGECDNMCTENCLGGVCEQENTDGGIDADDSDIDDSDAENPDGGDQEVCEECKTSYECACRHPSFAGEMNFPLIFLVFLGIVLLRIRE